MNEKVAVLLEIIKNRRSIFPASYLPGDLPEEAIQTILESANYAPTHKLTEPWRFTVFTGAGKTKLGSVLSEIYLATTPAEKFLQKKYESIGLKAHQAACIIAIVGNFHPDKVPEWEEIAAIGCAVQNMALTAEAMGIGAYWSTPATINRLGGFLDLKDNEKCLGLFYMGLHAAPSRMAVRTPVADKVKWIKA